ncbi:Nitroimidazol reductase NimA, pyridoxamine 5'-phosphate oxidase superfamily [Frankineae bacterium MT45]|nr:Nitroimidazol reductase NimA, pyridoxamine 5'-phosphate oxidase superfamily [Frankineae bacterium MT45]
MSASASATAHDLAFNECWDRLRSTPVGRLALQADRLEIFPINYVVDGGTIVFRTALGTKLSAIEQNAEVAFEADGWSSAPDEPVWSVVVHGQAHHLARYQLLETTDLPLFPWRSGAKEHFVRITPVEITGRQFVRVPPQSWPDPLVRTVHTSDD